MKENYKVIRLYVDGRPNLLVRDGMTFDEANKFVNRKSKHNVHKSGRLIWMEVFTQDEAEVKWGCGKELYTEEEIASVTPTKIRELAEEFKDDIGLTIHRIKKTPTHELRNLVLALYSEV